MATEDLTGTGKYIDDLVATNPAATDSVSDGDEHIRGVKNVLKNTFPNLTGAVTATHTELNFVDGVTSNIQAQINNLDPLPSQTGHSGKYLTTDATNASWATLAGQTQVNRLGGRKNLLINGGFDVWQRGVNGFGHGVYSADRWNEQSNTNDGLAVSRSNVPSSGEAGLPKTLTKMFKAALTAGSTGALNDLLQRIENPKFLMGATVTLSYYIKASVPCTISNRRVHWLNVTNPPAISLLPQLSVTTGWQRVTNTFTLNTNSSAAFTDSSSLDVVIGLPIHTTTNVYITGVQLELGDQATDFEHRSYGEELALCQRYYQKTKNAAGVVVFTTRVYLTVAFSTEMRTAPTMGQDAVFAVNDAGVNSLQSSTNLTAYNTNTIGTFVVMDNFSGLTRFRGVTSRMSGGYITADAEL